MLIYGNGRKKSTPFELVCSKVMVGDDCWEWAGYRNAAGYGTVRVGGRGGKPWLAHRLAFTVFVGPIRDGMHVLHKCDNPACVRPSHLFLGTNDDNIADRIRKGRPGGAQCWSRKRTGDEHHNVKVSDADVARIRERFGRGEKPKALANDFGINVSTAWRIATGRDRRLLS